MAEPGYLISKSTAEAIAKLIGKPLQPKMVSRAKFIGGGGSVPAGQYQGQVFQMITDNQTGWDYVLAHAPPP